MRTIDADALIEKCGGWYVDECTESGFIGTLENLLATEPTIQPQSTTGQLNDGARSTAQSTDLIDRGQAIEKFAMTAPQMSVIRIYEAVEILESMPTIQPELTDEQVIDYCGKKGYKIVADDLFDLLSKSEPQWIPVSERFPEDYADVLVWFEYFRYGDYNCMYATHGIGNYSKEYNSWTINHETGWKDLHVFAWMPLPEAYNPNK